MSSWPSWPSGSTTDGRIRPPTKLTSFGHLKGDWPHLEDIDDPVVLEAELNRTRTEYNGVRLHAGIGYVTPDDEHYGDPPSGGPASGGFRRHGRHASKQNRRTKKSRSVEQP